MNISHVSQRAPRMSPPSFDQETSEKNAWGHKKIMNVSCNLLLTLTSVCLVGLVGLSYSFENQCLRLIGTIRFDEPFDASKHHMQLTSENTLAYNSALALDHPCHEHFQTMLPGVDNTRRRLQGDNGYGGYITGTVCSSNECHSGYYCDPLGLCAPLLG